MKVAVVVPGGVDRSGEYRVIPSLLWLLERLACEHEVHVFSLYQEPLRSRYELVGTTVCNIGRRLTRTRTLAAVIAEHRSSPFDVLHAFWAVPPGVIATSAGRLLRRPTVLHVAGGELVAMDDIGYGGRLKTRGRIATRLALRLATRITAASSGIRMAVAAFGQRAEYLPLGVDLQRWPVRKPQTRATARPAQLLHIGSLNRVKDQETLLRAAAVLDANGVSFHLHIVGVDTLNGAMQRLAEELKLLARVKFQGFLPHRRLRPLVESADLLLISSRHEAGPVVLLEAAVAGVPTVGTAVGMVRDWAPRAAIAVPVGDHQALARETAALLVNDTRRLRLAEAAQARAVREDADWTAQRVQEIYHELTGSA